MFPAGFLCCSAAHQSPATKAGESQGEQPAVLWEVPELRAAQGGVQGAESRAQPWSLLGVSGEPPRTCAAAPATPRALPTLPLCFGGLERSLGTCPEEDLGPTRAEGRFIHGGPLGQTFGPQKRLIW